MRKIIFTIFISVGLMLGACESLVDDINDNPNAIVTDDIRAESFLAGTLLANSVAQAGHLNRISGLYSGQLIGFASLYSNIYGYSISTAESVTTWSRIYIGVLTNVRQIQNITEDDPLLRGISKVVEAHAIGTAASLFGDVPYSEVGVSDIPDPKFDSQMSVFNAVIDLLGEAIVDLQSSSSRGMPEDIYFNGDAQKWLESAYTLQARYYLQMKDYTNAYSAALNGIATAENNMKYIPRGDPSFTVGDKNLFWMILAGSRTGDIGTGDSYLMQLVSPDSEISRNNAKTDETARAGYYVIDENGASINLGITQQFEPHNLVTFQENQLILAEAGARTRDFSIALGHLNDLRVYLNTGRFLNVNFSNQPFTYLPYVAADFNAGGMENTDGIDATRALLREIIEERYVSGFGTYMPFNDVRRLAKSDSDIMVPFPLNTITVSQQPQRLPYSVDELLSNENSPAEDPGIFIVTEVNQ